MATVIDVIERVNKVRPNQFEDELMCEWLNHIEGRVVTELFKEGEYTAFVLPEGNTQELRLKAPYDDVYNWYMYAMIDMAHREYDAYQIDMEMFNAAWADAEAFIRKQNRQTKFINIVP